MKEAEERVTSRKSTGRHETCQKRMKKESQNEITTIAVFPPEGNI